MIALVRKTDSNGIKTQFTIVGFNCRDCYQQVDELNEYARTCDTGEDFTIIAWKHDQKWLSIYDGEILTL